MSILDILKSPVTQCALLMAVLAVLMAAAFWGLRRYRDYIGQNSSSAGELLTNYREMYEQGIISETEYRTIKSRLHAGMPRGSSESGGAG